MAKQTKETYWAQGKLDHVAVKVGNRHALARQAWANGSQSWQARAYRDGMQEAQDIENGYYTPSAVWMRTPLTERIALLHQAGTQYGAARAFESLPARIQFKLAHVINGTAYLLAPADAPVANPRQDKRIAAAIGNTWSVLRPIHPTVAAIFEIRRGLDARIRWFHRATGTLSKVAFDSLFAAERAALAWLRSQPVRPVKVNSRERMVSANRSRAEQLRQKYGYINSMESIPLSCKLQGPRHAPGVQWPTGERIASSRFQQISSRDAHGNECYRWQWAAFDEGGWLLQVMEFEDLWELREEAAFQIADGSRFARSQWRA